MLFTFLIYIQCKRISEVSMQSVKKDIWKIKPKSLMMHWFTEASGYNSWQSTPVITALLQFLTLWVWCCSQQKIPQKGGPLRDFLKVTYMKVAVVFSEKPTLICLVVLSKENCYGHSLSFLSPCEVWTTTECMPAMYLYRKVHIYI